MYELQSGQSGVHSHDWEDQSVSLYQKNGQRDKRDSTISCPKRSTNVIDNRTYADSKVESYLGGFIAGPIRLNPPPDVKRDGDDQIDTWRQSVASVQDQIKAVESNPFHSFNAGKLCSAARKTIADRPDLCDG